jgi:hypothetical protein
MVRLFVVGNFLMQVVAAKMDVQQNLDAQNLDEVLTFPDEVNLVHHRLDVVVDAALHRQLKMDYFLDVVGVELRHQLKMDYFLDVVSQVLLQHLLMMLHLQKELLVVAQHFLRVKL